VCGKGHEAGQGGGGDFGKWQPAGWTAPTPINGARKYDRSSKHSKHPLIINRDRFTEVVPEPVLMNKAALARHDRVHCTNGCATYGVPSWARVFLKAAVCFARLAPGKDQHLLVGPHDHTDLLRVAEAARLRPLQPPAGQRTGRMQV
ncbi:hypothetical protein ACFV19_31745, partial [Streptomyces griseoluteus]